MTKEGYAAKTKAVLELRELLSKTNTLINDTRTYKTQLEELKNKLDQNKSQNIDESLYEDIKNALNKIKDLQDDILKRPPPSMTYRQRPRLREEIRSLMRAVNGAIAKPTQPQKARVEQLRDELNEALKALEQIINTNIQKINDKTKDIPQISIGKKNQ